MAKPQTAHLRKRRIVLLGHHTSVLAFCEGFQSDWAELTIVTQSPFCAPRVVRHGIAAGLIKADEVAVDLRERFRRRRGVQVIVDSVDTIDLEKRVLKLCREQTLLEFDFLLVGPEKASGDSDSAETLTVTSISDATAVANAMKESQACPIPVRIPANDTDALDLAVTFARKHPLQKRVFLECAEPFYFPNRQISEKVAAKFARQMRWESVALVKPDWQASVSANQINLVPHRCELPGWFPSLQAEENTGGVDRHLYRPDLRLRQHERIYLLPELVHTCDSVGSKIPHSDAAILQQGRYLARLLKSIIEAKQRPGGDLPSFVFNDFVSLATLRWWKSIGFVGQRLVLPAPAAFTLDMCCIQLQVFATYYGWQRALSRLVHWLARCK
jgi:NADH dehydrogenase FAD-containing subunit